MNRFEIAATLTETQRQKFFRLASALKANKAVNNRWIDEEQAAKVVLPYLQAANWNVKLAKQAMTMTRVW